jgi:formiminotetrahydrofolate cyclodeaminase
MRELTALSVAEFLDRTADRVPTPGGGSVTALTGALACALAQMVAGYSKNSGTEPVVAGRVDEAALHLQRAGQLMRALVDQDAAVYGRMTDAAKRVQSDPSARAAYQEAVLAAVAVPMETAAVASQALTIMGTFQEVAAKSLVSDLAIAAILAEATARAARYTVQVNLRLLDDASTRSRLVAEIDEIVSRCASLSSAVQAFARERLNGGPAERR